MDIPSGTCSVQECSPNSPLCASSLTDLLRRFEREAEFGSVDTGRYRCSYYSWGNGPALVFVPGLCDDSKSFIATIANLCHRFRCIAYDTPTGEDDARLGSYRHADYVSDLGVLLDHLRITKSYLCGCSFGSTISLSALHRWPERFPRAILQGGFAHRPLAWAEVLLARFARYWKGPMGRLPFHERVLQHSHHAPFNGRPQEFWDYFVQRFDSPPMAAVAHRALVLHQVDLRPKLSEIRQPVLMVCGEDDPLVGKNCEETLLSGLPNVSRVEIQGAGHLPQYSHPEVLAHVIEEFLTPSSPEPPATADRGTPMAPAQTKL